MMQKAVGEGPTQQLIPSACNGTGGLAPLQTFGFVIPAPPVLATTRPADALQLPRLYLQASWSQPNLSLFMSIIPCQG